MSAPVLRPYQQQLAEDVRGAYRLGFKCPLVVASTGAGKTVLFSYITHGAVGRGNPVLIAAHRKEIIRQISLSLAKFGVEHQVIAPPKLVRQIMVAQFKVFGRVFVKNGALAMVGSVQTIVGRFDQIDAVVQRCGKRPLIVIDEGHHVVEDTQWGRVMERYQDAPGLIVTASPERLDGRGLGKGHGGYADTMIEAPPMSWLIENGYLSPYRIFTAPRQIDMSGVHTRMGDYIASEVEERVDKKAVTGDAIAHYQKHASGLRAVVFCVSVTHSKHVASEFNAAGIPAAHIDGGSEDDERDQAIVDFADGRISVLCNVGLVSEGFDLGSIAQKDVTIDCIIDLAPTESLVSYMQRAGRALRPAPGKVAILLDHAGNVFRHGLPDDDRQWLLEGRKKTRRAANDNDEPGVDRVMTCMKCYSVHLPEPACPSCGHVYPIKERTVEQTDGDLVELSGDQLEAMRRQKRVMQGQAQSVEALVAQGISRLRAMKIIEARRAKQEVVDGIMQQLDEIRASTGQGPFAASGHTLMEIRRMKPKELRELADRLENMTRSEVA